MNHTQHSWKPVRDIVQRNYVGATSSIKLHVKYQIMPYIQLLLKWNNNESIEKKKSYMELLDFANNLMKEIWQYGTKTYKKKKKPPER